MLSILIPVYKFDVTQLVKDIHQQATAAGIAFEIRCYDDASGTSHTTINSTLAEMDGVVYKEFDENQGRSRIRNLLADDAQFAQLLFLDCDSSTPDSQFIQRYIDAAGENHIVYGGRSYETNAPSNKRFYLRWLYGRERETISATQRSEQPYSQFMTNNFLVPSSIYNSIRLDETLKGYGHEDTLFGVALSDQNIPVVHIENPLLHLGLEDAETFLQKTKEGLSNLHFLIRSGKIGKEVKIYRYFKRTKKLGMNRLLLKSFRKNESKIVANLTSSNPNLKRFDFYKLGHLLEIDAQQKGK